VLTLAFALILVLMHKCVLWILDFALPSQC
jgi:hypothetical protein